MVLYRKYRPQTLSEIIGQEHIRDSILASLSSGKISHAYLFTGPRGTGKTSIARILAKAINCEKNVSQKGNELIFGEPCNNCSTCSAITAGSQLDIMEIDAASNRGIDEIRDLKEKIKLSPASGRFKVYIIDEAHMLTAEAFNALLKTLEEPPAHAIFVLATTEPQKIPLTIASRSTRFDFKVPSEGQIKEKLALITKKEGWKLPDESLEEISRIAGGAFRDAEVILEKIAGFDSAANLVKTQAILGKKDIGTTINFLKLLQEGKTQGALVWLDDYVKEGGSIRVFTDSILDTLRKILLLKAGAESVIGAVAEREKENLQKEANTISKQRVLQLVDLFNKSGDELRNASIPQLPLEIAVIEATLETNSEENEVVVPIKKFTQKSVNSPVEIPKNTGINSSRSKPEDTARIKTSQKGKEVRKTPVGKSLRKLQNHWNEFLKKIKPINNSLELFLRQASPVDLDEDVLTIEFAYRFHKEKATEKKYRDILEDALAKFTGSRLQVKGVIAKKAPEPEKIPDLKKGGGADDIDPALFGTLD